MLCAKLANLPYPAKPWRQLALVLIASPGTLAKDRDAEMAEALNLAHGPESKAQGCRWLTRPGAGRTPDPLTG